MSGNHTQGINAHGGGFYAYTNTVTLNNSTITQNNANLTTGDGIYVYYEDDLTVTLSSTILTDNGTNNISLNADGGTETLNATNSLIGTEVVAELTSNTDNQVSDTPELITLADNGCAIPAGAPATAACVQTHGLLAASPALDVGANTLIPPLDFDQRGTGFPRISNGQADIGSFELIVNQPPVAVDDNYTTNENTAVILSPLTGDSDPEGDTLTLTAINSIALTGGAQTITVTDGTIDIDASDVIGFTSDIGVSGDVTIPYIISDGNGGTATANQIIAVNGLPIAVDDNYSTNEGTAVVLTPLTGDSDPEGDTLALTAINSIALTGGAQTIAVTDGSIDIDASDIISFTPDTGFTGTITIPYTISDGDGTATANQIIAVNAVIVLGDCTGEGDINIQDIICDINIVLDDGIAVNGADCDGIGDAVNTQDVICTINKVLE